MKHTPILGSRVLGKIGFGPQSVEPSCLYLLTSVGPFNRDAPIRSFKTAPSRTLTTYQRPTDGDSPSAVSQRTELFSELFSVVARQNQHTIVLS